MKTKRKILYLAFFVSITFLLIFSQNINARLPPGDYPDPDPDPDPEYSYSVTINVKDQNTGAGIVGAHIDVSAIEYTSAAPYVFEYDGVTQANGKCIITFSHVYRFDSIRAWASKYCYETNNAESAPSFSISTASVNLNLNLEPETDSGQGIDYRPYLCADEKRTLSDDVKNKAQEICQGLTTDTDCYNAIYTWLDNNYDHTGDDEVEGVDVLTDSQILEGPTKNDPEYDNIYDGLWCTESAVITSALFRAIGIPSRALHWAYEYIVGDGFGDYDEHDFCEVALSDNNWRPICSCYHWTALGTVEQWFIDQDIKQEVGMTNIIGTRTWPDLDSPSDTNNPGPYLQNTYPPLIPKVPSKIIGKISDFDLFVPLTFEINHFITSHEIDTPYGTGYHVDTIGSGEYGYTFMAYYNEDIYSNSHGELEVFGWFRQYDTLYSYAQPGRRYLKAYVLNAETTEIVQSITVLDYTDGTNWNQVAFIIDNLDPGTAYKIAFGRRDAWSYDWKLTAEWADITIDNSE